MNDQEKHLLHAILDEDESTAMTSFTAWSDSVCFENIEGGTYRLIPSLYKRIASLQTNFTHKDRMKGIYRYFLYKNRMQIHKSMEVLDALDTAGIDFLLLKGAALIAVYYDSPALRPMNDIDILVKTEDAKSTYELLSRLGWAKDIDRDFQQTFHSTHSINLKRKDHVDIDLHWNVIYQVAWQGSENAYWNETEKVVYGNHTARVLRPEMQILHNMAHGLRYNPMSAIRWIPDVMQIIKIRADEIDWNHFLDLATERRLVYTVRHGMDILSAFNPEIPTFFMESLQAIPVSRYEKRLHESMSQTSRFALFKVQWRIYLLIREDDPMIKRIAGLPKYLKSLIGCNTYGEVTSFLLKKAWKFIMQ